MSVDRTFFNEMLDDAGMSRPAYSKLEDWLNSKPPNFLKKKNREAETIFRRLGITFAVYGSNEATERLIPFDPIPRILSASEWRRLSAGIDQRVRALNAFLHDIYHRQEIIRAGRIPADLIIQNEAFLPEMVGFTPARKVYAHIIGTDLVRVGKDDFYVLEDNTRTPSGVSYMMENRETMMRMFPELFEIHRVAPVEHYPDSLRQTLESVGPDQSKSNQTVVVLTPGIYNSAYFEHAFWPIPWVWNWSKVVTSSSMKARFSCAQRANRSRSTSFIGASMMRFSIPSPSSQIPCWVFPVFSMRIAQAMSPSATLREPALPMTRRSMPMCRKSSSSIRVRNRS
ncbi:carboxylate-amine ligase [Roseibium sp. TrichSKD4]|nr:carboxylate-amine ligase [Roseibium sp. TrichSKD4]